MAIKVPPGQHPPFEVVDDQHKAGIIIIVAAICLVLTLVCLLIRAYVRLHLSPASGVDDLILVAATICGVAESIIVFHAASIGFGTTIALLKDEAIRNIQKSLVASDALYLVTLYLSRCCIIAIYHRLTPRTRHQIILWVVLAVSTASTIISIIIITANCSLNTPWAPPAQSCSNFFGRWQFIAAINIITEVFLFSFSFALVHKLQMPVRNKLVILLSFASRLPLIIFESLRLEKLHIYVHSPNPTFTAIPHFTWTQVALNYSIIACTVYCLRPFMNAIATYYGTAGDSNLGSSKTTKTYPSGSRSGSRSRETDGKSHALRSLNKDSGRGGELFVPRDSGRGEAEAVVMAPPPGSAGRGDVSDQEERDGSVWSEDSTRMIIRKDVEYTVSHAPREG